MAYTVIGITGLPGSGKSEVAAIMAELGAHVINADHVGHAILAEDEYCRQIAARFGKEVLNSDSKVDRTALAAIVFSDPKALDDLELILHPVMNKRISDEVEKKRKVMPVVIDAALLWSMRLAVLVDIIILVQADPVLRQERTAMRGWNRPQLSSREQRLAQDMKSIRDKAHLVVSNNGSMDNLRTTITHFWKEEINGNNTENRPSQ